MLAPSRLYVGPTFPFETGFAWTAVLPPTLTWLSTTPGTSQSVAQTLRALGICWSSTTPNVAPVTVRRGSIAGVVSVTVTVSDTGASCIVTRTGVLRATVTSICWRSTVANPSRDRFSA